MKMDTARNGTFKTKGAGILKRRPSGPKNMKEFLERSEPVTASDQIDAKVDNQKHKGTIAQARILTKVHMRQPSADSLEPSAQTELSQSETLTRLHVHIREDLADKLLETVFRRKRERQRKQKDATQRVIIEEALEEYFIKRGM